MPPAVPTPFGRCPEIMPGSGARLVPRGMRVEALGKTWMLIRSVSSSCANAPFTRTRSAFRSPSEWPGGAIRGRRRGSGHPLHRVVERRRQKALRARKDREVALRAALCERRGMPPRGPHWPHRGGAILRMSLPLPQPNSKADCEWDGTVGHCARELATAANALTLTRRSRGRDLRGCGRKPSRWHHQDHVPRGSLIASVKS